MASMPITCDNFGKEMASFGQWFEEGCHSDPSTGHVAG